VLARAGLRRAWTSGRKRSWSAVGSAFFLQRWSKLASGHGGHPQVTSTSPAYHNPAPPVLLQNRPNTTAAARVCHRPELGAVAAVVGDRASATSRRQGPSLLVVGQTGPMRPVLSEHADRRSWRSGKRDQCARGLSERADRRSWRVGRRGLTRPAAAEGTDRGGRAKGATRAGRRAERRATAARAEPLLGRSMAPGLAGYWVSSATTRCAASDPARIRPETSRRFEAGARRGRPADHVRARPSRAARDRDDQDIEWDVAMHARSAPRRPVRGSRHQRKRPSWGGDDDAACKACDKVSCAPASARVAGCAVGAAPAVPPGLAEGPLERGSSNLLPKVSVREQWPALGWRRAPDGFVAGAASAIARPERVASLLEAWLSAAGRRRSVIQERGHVHAIESVRGLATPRSSRRP
jgi:hypothetical protein